MAPMIDDDDRDNVIPFAERDRDVAAELGILSVWDAIADLRRMQALPTYSTPFESLTEAIGLGGWMAGQVYVLVGGTGVGKTTFTLAAARHFAELHGPVLYLTEEMRPGHCYTRAAARTLGVTSNQLIRGTAAYDDEALAQVLPKRLMFMRKTTPDKIRKAVLYLRQQHRCAPLVVVDYLQKLAAQVAAGMERPDMRLATTQVSSELCKLAEDLDAPVLAVSSGGRSANSKLRGNRAGAKRQDPRDMPPSEMVDTAKESGDVEYDSAALMTISMGDEVDVDGHQVATLTVAKARYGRAQHIAMAYDGVAGEWHDRGRVEPRKADSIDTAQISAARAEELEQCAAAIVALVKVAPMSRNAIAKALKKRKTDVLDAVMLLRSRGEVYEQGTGPAVRVILTELGGAPPPLPYMLDTRRAP